MKSTKITEYKFCESSSLNLEFLKLYNKCMSSADEAYVYFNEYEQAKTLYENMDFSDFLFDSESALGLL